MYHKKPQNIEAWCSHCPIQEQVRALKKRIESDKNHLQELESQLKESNGMKGTDSGANWEVHLRDNPTFQHRFDAMDSYLGPPRSGLSASKPESKQSKRAKTLFKECQKRINAAEALLEQANSEVRCLTLHGLNHDHMATDMCKICSKVSDKRLRR